MSVEASAAMDEIDSEGIVTVPVVSDTLSSTMLVEARSLRPAMTEVDSGGADEGGGIVFWSA